MNVTDLKRFAKNILMKKQFRSYEKKLNGLKMTYDGWIRPQEEKLRIDKIIISVHEKCLKNEAEKQIQDGSGYKNEGIHSKMIRTPVWYEVRKKEEGTENTVKFLCLPVWQDGKGEEAWIPEIRAFGEDKNTNVILFVMAEGMLSDLALPMLFKTWNEEMPVLVYGDEDVMAEQGREKPWFKPDWSPDTFLSYFYMGSLVALPAKAVCECLDQNKQLVEGLSAKEALTRKNAVYELCYRVINRGIGQEISLTGKGCVRRIDEVLYHTAEEGYGAVEEMRLPAYCTFGYERQGSWQLEDGKDHLVSVIIPSKDNPEVLFHCISSLTERTKWGIPYEIILVDNGRREENQILIKQNI